MFLALKEMRYAKLRYGLIIGMMVLIAYVVFMLSGLARGLAEEFKKGVDDWQAQEIVLSEEANKTLAASQLTMDDFEQVTAKQKAPIGIYSGAIKDQQQNVTVFGTTNDAFLLPKLIKGHPFKTKNEIIIPENLAKETYQIGDTLKIGNYPEPLKIVGITAENYYTVTPVIYTTLDTWTQLKFGDQPLTTQQINAVVTKEKAQLPTANETMVSLTIPDLIENIPGYSAQNLTLDAMIYFLFVVATAVVGIFMYVITLQKTAIFGVMKAQGIRNRFIANSLVAQAFIVGMIGVGLAMVLAFGTSFILPEAMPFAIIWSQWLVYSGLFIIVAIIGSLFSIRTVAKVDPITAIGG